MWRRSFCGEEQKEGAMELSPRHRTRRGKLTADRALIRTWWPDLAGSVPVEINGSSAWLRTALYYIVTCIICICPESTSPNSVWNCTVLLCIIKKRKIYFLPLFCNKARKKQFVCKCLHIMLLTQPGIKPRSPEPLSSRQYYPTLIRFLNYIPNLTI